MALISPIKPGLQNPKESKTYSASLRLWHWINTVLISGSLITVLINSTLLKQSQVSLLLKDTFQKSGITLSNDVLKSAAHDLNDRTWDVHTYFGYFVSFFLLFRIILEFFEPADQRFFKKIKDAYRNFRAVRERREQQLHELTVKTIYAAFYVLLITMILTGLFLAFEDALVAYKSIRHTVKNVHGFCMYLILAFILVHLAGVFLAERKGGKGIVSDMIGGGDGISK